MLSKERCKTTAGFFVIPLLSQLWEEKNYCERRNELNSWRPVALPNHHIHLYLFKLGYDVYALLSSVMYILSGENSIAVFTISRRRWDQNTTQVANMLNRTRATYVRLLHLPPWFPHIAIDRRGIILKEAKSMSGVFQNIDARHCSVLYICKYFVPLTLLFSSK